MDQDDITPPTGSPILALAIAVAVTILCLLVLVSVSACTLDGATATLTTADEAVAAICAATPGARADLVKKLGAKAHTLDIACALAAATSTASP